MKSKLERVWDNQVNYLGEWEFKEHNLTEKNILLDWLKQIPRGKVLDAGCGLGQYTIYPSKLDYSSTGLDISKKCLETARKNSKKYKVKARFVLGDVRKLPFKNKTFNIVISTGVVEHFKETQKALDESFRVLKDKGELLIYVPYKYTVFILNKNLQQLLGLWKAGYEKSYSIRKFRKMLKKSGFKVKDVKKDKIYIGRNKLVGRVLRILDWPLSKLGMGGQHVYFRAVK